jgi:parvulin-like peptidyl-prolyl isomerase
MNRLLTIALVVIALAAGTLTGEFLSKQMKTHRFAGRIFGWGELVAIFHHRGIFDRELIADEVLQVSAAHERVNKGKVDRAMFALRGQFDGERNFATALRANGIWHWQLQKTVASVFRGENWIEERLAKMPVVPSIDEERGYFDEHQIDFSQPLRLRARHIFLAAPQGSDSDVIEEKQAAMEEIMVRLEQGEDFASLAAGVSEDEATKSRGGDLGFFASNRVPQEFWSAIENLPANGPITFVQTHLGFHAIQILDIRLPRMMTFEEVRPEIEQILAEGKRRAEVGKMRKQLAREALLVSQ